MSREVEARVGAVSAAQHGAVTRRQLLEAGMCRTAIVHRIKCGRLTALHRGVYLALPFPLPHTRAMAAVLASGPGGVLSFFSAAALWGIHPGADESAPVDVMVEGNGGRRSGIRVHRVQRLAADERTEREGLPVTTAGRTLVDLAGVLTRRELEAALARAEREGLVRNAELATLLARHVGQRGIPALKAVLDIAGGPALTRSAAEERLLSLIRDAGLPAPGCNVSVGPYEVDFLWRDARIAVEVDGYRFHSTRWHFEGDRRKDAYLLAAGISVVRFSWRQMTEQPLATAVQLAQALTRAGGCR